jgi:hypothetical protein
VRAEPQRLDRSLCVRRVTARQQDHLRRGLVLTQRRQQAEAAETGHAHVRDHDMHRLTSKGFEGLRPIARLEDDVSGTAQMSRHQAPDDRAVVHQQDPLGSTRHCRLVRVHDQAGLHVPPHAQRRCKAPAGEAARG